MKQFDRTVGVVVIVLFAIAISPIPSNVYAECTGEKVCVCEPHMDPVDYSKSFTKGSLCKSDGVIYPPASNECSAYECAGLPGTGSTEKTVATDRDPVNMSNGDYFENMALMNIGGPIPLRFDLFRDSGYNKHHSYDGLPFNFYGNFSLFVLNNGKEIEVDMGLGSQIYFIKSGASWVISSFQAVKYSLQESADYWYLMNPEKALVYTFKKQSYRSEAMLTRIEDRNGNAFVIENLADVTRGPARVSDGIGRELKFTYGAVSGSSNLYLSKVEDGTGRAYSFAYRLNTSGNEIVLLSITDPMGNITGFEYLTRFQVAKKTMPAGNAPYSQLYFSSISPSVAKQTDAYGNSTDFTSDYSTVINEGLHKYTATYADGTTSRFDHDFSGRVLRGISDQTGKQSIFSTLNEKDRFDSVTDRLGDTTSYTYHDESGRIATLTNARGKTISNTYETQNQIFTNPANGETAQFTFYLLKSVSYPDGTARQMTYDSKGNLITSSDQAGKQTTYTYNSKGQVLTVTNPLGGIVTSEYNSDGTLASRKDSNTGKITYSYDIYKRPNKITNPDSTFIQAVYNLNDQITSITDENGNSYTFTYNANGALTASTGPDGKSTQYAYDLMDRVSSSTDRAGKISAYTYNNMERLSSTADPNSLATSYTYNSRGWKTGMTLGGRTWLTGYDDEGVPVSVTTPLGFTTSYTTDKLGLTSSITNSLGHKTVYIRDTMGRLTGITDPLNRQTTYSYDPRGNLSGAAIAPTGTATYSRNDLGLLSGITDLGGGTWSFSYNSTGLLTSLTDPLTRQTTNTYDSRGRLSGSAYPGGGSSSVTYDNASNLTGMNYSAGPALTYGYDTLNRLLTSNDITLTRDAEGRVTGTGSGGVIYAAGYDDGGRLVSANYNNGAFSVTYSYDTTTGLLSRVEDTLTGSRLDFSFDNDNRLTGISRAGGISSTYSYDSAGRLTRIQEGAIIDISHIYDAAGQVTSTDMTAPLDAATALMPETSTYSYNAASEITSSGFGYDSLGRRTSSPTATFTWDGASRLTGINPPSGSGQAVALTYNGLNDLLSRTEGGQTIRYFYNRAISLSPIMAEKNDSTGAIVRYYVWTPGGQLLYMIDAADGNKVYHYHFDKSGSTLALTNASGTVTDAYAYTSYGRMLLHTGTSTQPFTFVGRYGVRQEGQAGTLYQMRARYFDALTAQFLSRESEWPKLDSPKELNPYQYALLNPLSYIDPTGLSVLLDELWMYHPGENRWTKDIPKYGKRARRNDLGKAEKASAPSRWVFNAVTREWKLFTGARTTAKKVWNSLVDDGGFHDPATDKMTDASNRFLGYGIPVANDTQSDIAILDNLHLAIEREVKPEFMIGVNQFYRWRER